LTTFPDASAVKERTAGAALGDPRIRRDAGLVRIARTTRVVGTAAVALVWVVAAVAAGSAPGRSASTAKASPRARPTTVQLPGASGRLPRRHRAQSSPEASQAQADPSSEGDPGLQPPQQAPAPTEAPPAPVSGGS
jgi:hypothetical protein